MNDTTIYTEMGQTTDAQITYRVGYSRRYYITTDLQLSGRGIEQNGDGSDHLQGKKTYTATEKALEKLKTTYTTCNIASL
jgi:hypothetical protein